ncbi:plasmid partitioning/stability family protein [Enterobacter asburiae]|uniref:plasmid partitioning/stability family protein n=1 Tax=Enterobacter asburiae TaxID=61645 RepID=UPI001F191F39|nr:plasmid partitioning/stability family protein [Enterobacter asburiae]EKS7402024.1 plasmid partitioning/stability family protein [Enterobacter roggenkampii]MCF1343089.1 plasmid partitioning/stability family protein [Enterobacter asburiae]MCQ4341464.1 plasmid partitioning/stability family protein [Enterobacter asburiae]HAS1942576.1 plasmid stability protein [Enterobacter asburiae]HDC4533927.1 plasmid partitioning/stability family protein [Enterobacter asburiae]
MDKPDPRRKITFYLNPESNAAERYVCEEIEKMPQGERGNLWRAALLSGFALRKQDERLPHLLAAQLTESTTFEEMVLLMQSVFPEEMKALDGRRPASGKEPEVACQEQASTADTDDETRRNAQNMFGRG